MLLSLSFESLLNGLPGNIAQGMIWGIMAIGVYLTFRILDFADLTVDGSIATGGAVAVILIRNGVNPWIAILISFGAGMLAGMVTGLLHTVLGIPGILASILTQLALYSVNYNIMGKTANLAVSVDNYKLVASMRYVNSTGWQKPAFFAGLSVGLIILVVIIYRFFGTEVGHAIRATGCNENMSRAQGINTNFIKVLTLMLSNGLVGLCGGIYAQYQGANDVGMGRGAIVIGLAAVVIGEVVLGKLCAKSRIAFALTLLSVVFGSIMYYMVYAVVIWLKLPAENMKLISASIVAVFLAIPYLKGKYFKRKSDGLRKTFGKEEKRGRGTADPVVLEQESKLQTPEETAAVEADVTAPKAEVVGTERPKPEFMLQIAEVQKIFNAGTINEKVALNQLSIDVKEGDFITVIGGNGAGKSTMLNAIAGLWPIDQGKILIGGKDVTRLPEHKRAPYLGRVFQDPMTGTAATMSIEENLALAARRGKRKTLRWGVTKAEREIYRKKLEELDLGLETRLTSKVGLLSGGQRQAVTLLMAALERPDLLLLDEHTAALDPKTAAKVLELSEKIIRENGLTAMMITHNMKDAIAHGNRLIMMYDGHIIYDVSGEEKKNLRVEDLLEKFKLASGGHFANDRMMLTD